MLGCSFLRCAAAKGEPALRPPCRSFLVRQWVHQWGRFLLFLAGFYYIPVRGWRNVRAAEECR